MAYWLVKTEPEEFSYSDLVQKGREPWNGVRNPTALKHIRAMKPGDHVMIYHTGDERAIVGVGQVVSEPYPDPTAGEPKLVVADVIPLYQFTAPVTLAAVKADPAFASWELVRQSRLSVMPVSHEHWTQLHHMGQTPVVRA